MAAASVRQIPAERQRVAESKWEWEKVILRSDLPRTARLCALVLATYMNANGSGARPSVERIARDMAVDESTAKRARRALRDGGYLAWERGCGEGKACRYTPLVPAAQERSPSEEPPAANGAPTHPQTVHPRPPTRPRDQTNNMMMMGDLTGEEFNSIVATQAAATGIDVALVLSNGHHVDTLRRAVAEKRDEGWTVEEIAHAGWDWSNNPESPIVNHAAWIARRIEKVKRKPTLDENGQPKKPKKKAKQRSGGMPEARPTPNPTARAPVSSVETNGDRSRCEDRGPARMGGGAGRVRRL